MSAVKRKNFYTIFPRTENFHLVKDVGMVPYILHRFYGYQSTIATYKNTDSYPFLNTEVQGLKLDFIPQTYRSRNANVALYILKNFRKIDALQFYHFEIDQVDMLGLFIILKKIFFQKSFTCIKCDGSDRFTNTDLSTVKFKFFRKWVISKINLFTVETSCDFNIIKSLKDYQNINLQLMPNGFFDGGKTIDISPKKEKIILTVGRLGTAQKNTEFLLEAFAAFAKTDPEWQLYLVGSIEESFQPQIEKFYSKNPALKARVVFTGAITDREIIGEYYRKSAVFILTSRAEGSPLVVPEALSAGCFHLLSDRINLKDDIICNGRFGRSFSIQDKADLIAAFHSLNQIDFEILKFEIQNFAYDLFYWPKVVEIIDTHFKKSIHN
ncbi:glycosyltransferase [Chryseobacterium sp. SC28]|uniref:glycosyltransferase n=1 Tax=Chryseobacterium sp. SC28 TaxID=2268028 RepID=UPI000F64F41E|nr:glycosyltransferase [Chryseobacterium sp. SC28]RRQ45849.1 glycosyltransferase [Chryseobacterium sp. SC28]